MRRRSPRPAVIESVRTPTNDGTALLIGEGSTPIAGHLSAVARWNPGRLEIGQVAHIVVDVPTAALGDTVVAAFGAALPVGSVLTASVQQEGKVLVQLLVLAMGALVFSEPSDVRIDLWKH